MSHTRPFPDWIAAYVEYMKDTEFPNSYHIWNAISCIAGALQRRVYMPWGRQTIYPNMYVILVGPSGLGKGESMRPVIDIFTQVPGLNVAPDSVTIQELIRLMGALKDNTYATPEGLYKTQTAMQVFAKELVVLLGTKDMKKVSILTDLYDSHDIWKDGTKTQGSAELSNICLNILGASAPDWFSTMLPLESMGGGFTSRIVFVVENQKSKINPRPPYEDWHKLQRDLLIADLQRIASLTGTFEFTEDADKVYNEFYYTQEKNIQKGIFPIHDPAFEGYATRRTLHLRKMCLAISAARGRDGEVPAEDFQTAVQILEATETRMPRLFGGVGRGQLGPIINSVIEYLLKYGDSKRSSLMRAFYKDLDASTLDIVESTLERMNFIKVMRAANARDAEYIVNYDWEKNK